MSVKHSFSKNGSGDHRSEIASELEFEERELMAGRQENPLFMKAIANNWSAAHFFQVARWKGKNWRFLSALSDKALELEGYAVLDFLADAYGRDFAEQVFRKSLSALARAMNIYERFKAIYGDNPFAEQMFLELAEDEVRWTQESRQRYWSRLRRLLE